MKKFTRALPLAVIALLLVVTPALACSYSVGLSVSSNKCESISADGYAYASDHGRKIKADLLLDGILVDTETRTTSGGGSSKHYAKVSYDAPAAAGTYTFTVVGYKWAQTGSHQVPDGFTSWHSGYDSSAAENSWFFGWYHRHLKFKTVKDYGFVEFSRTDKRVTTEDCYTPCQEGNTYEIQGLSTQQVYNPVTDMLEYRTVFRIYDNQTHELCGIRPELIQEDYPECEGAVVEVPGPWTPWTYDNFKDRRERKVEVRDATSNDLCGWYTEREAKCKDLFRMWFLRNEEGDECFLISDTHPSVERQNQLCRPCSNPDWTSVKSWSGMVNSCDEWEMDKYISLSRLPLEELLKVNDRHTGKECRLPLQTCE